MDISEAILEETPWTPVRAAVFMLSAAGLHFVLSTVLPSVPFDFVRAFSENGELSYPGQLDLMVLMSLVLAVPAVVSAEFWEDERLAQYLGAAIAFPPSLLLYLIGEEGAVISFMSLAGMLVIYYAAMREDIRHPSRHAAVVTISACALWTILPALACGAFAGMILLLFLVGLLLAVNEVILTLKFKLFYE